MKSNDVKITRFKALSLNEKYEDENDHASLVWSIRAGYPRVTIYTTNTQVGDSIDYGKVIIAPLSYDILYDFVRIFKKIIKDKPNTEHEIECLNLRFVDGVRTNEKYLQATIHIGKDKDGIIYLMVTEEKKKKVKFYFKSSEWHRIKISGSYVENKEAQSVSKALSYIKRLETSFDLTLKDTIVNGSIPAPNVKK